MGVIHHRISIAFSKRFSAIVFMASFLVAFSLQGQSDTLQAPTDFRVVTILPFFTDLFKEKGIPSARRESRMREIAVEHMHGIQWAAERLSNEGYHIELLFFDEVADILGLNQWDVEDIYDADVVFGPLQLSPISISRRTIERTGAEHILLTPVPDAFLRGSDAIRTVISSQLYAVDVMARDIADKHSQDNVVFVMSGGNDLELEERFLDVFNRELQTDTVYADSLLFDTVYASRNSIGSLPEKLDEYSRNVIVSLAGRASRSMLSNLQLEVQINASTEIFVYTHQELKDLGFIDATFLERTRATMTVSEEMNWSDSATIAAVQVYKGQFKGHPSKYSIRAHDAFLDAFVRKMERDLGPMDFSVLPAPISTAFDWVAVDQFSGYVNKHWKLKTFYKNQWCDSDSVPALLEFIEP
jgi:hypothetical protein